MHEMTGWQTVLFLAGTAGLTYISRSSLRKPGSHGFYRFLAWESILALVLLNAPAWFRDWAAWHQIISWLFLVASLVPLWLGFRELRRGGRADRRHRRESELLSFERTTALVTEGIYRCIRHPLYCSLFLLTWGAYFKAPSPAGTALAVGSSIFLLMTAKADEAECIAVFGEDYRHYMERTKMFLPYIL
jgi:protein-S-isoprenylcysteine O-methyltransferase Ste14